MTKLDNDLISRKALLEAVNNGFVEDAADAIYLITNAPTIEADSGEPVAWCRRDTILNWGGQIINAAMMFPSPKGLKEAIPLYTSPQQREWKDIDLSEYENQGLGVIAEEICTKLKQLNSEKG